MSKKIITQEKLKKTLLKSLAERGIPQDFYVDLINDYMALWVIKQNLIKDIANRGVNIEYQNGANQYGVKQNDSVGNLIKTNMQMLKILQELGLRGADQQVGDVDEEL